jgi:hypothetical protein
MSTHLQLAPSVCRHGKIRHGAIVATSHAKPVFETLRHQPVAGIARRVLAQEATLASAGHTEAGSILLQREQSLRFRVLTERMTALAADPVLKIQNIAAGPARKELHRKSSHSMQASLARTITCGSCPAPAPSLGDAARPAASVPPSPLASHLRHPLRSARTGTPHPCVH